MVDGHVVYHIQMRFSIGQSKALSALFSCVFFFFFSHDACKLFSFSGNDNCEYMR